jgi:hypothetical protein
MCLLDDLADIFSPTIVSRMSDQELEELAGESLAQQSQRHQLTDKKDKLKSALRECLAHGYTSMEGKLVLWCVVMNAGLMCTLVPPRSVSSGRFQTSRAAEEHLSPSANVRSINTPSSNEADHSTASPSSQQASDRVNTIVRAAQSGNAQTPTNITSGFSSTVRSSPATGYSGPSFGGSAPSTPPATRTSRSTHQPRNAQSSPAVSNGHGTVPAPATLWQPRSAPSTGSFIANNPSEVRGIITSFPYSPYTEEEHTYGASAELINQFQSITAMSNYKGLSHEELRLRDYLAVEACNGSLVGARSSAP